MRILYFGSTSGTECALHYFTAFSRLGHEVLPFDPGYFRGDDPIARLAIRLRRGPSEAKRRAVGRQLAELCRRNRFDVVFVIAENFLSREDIAAARDASGRTPPHFIYHSHDNNFARGICLASDFLSTLACFDTVFTTKKRNVSRYEALGQRNAHYVPSAYEPTVHHPVPPAYRRAAEPIDVSFVGTYAPSRLPALEAVGWERLQVWGQSWPRWSGYWAHAARITPRPIFFFELADVLSRSRISLGLLREEVEDRHTQRTFEIPACGSLQIAPRTDEILEYFDEGREIVCFDSPEELRDKVGYYLTHEKERARIAKQGHLRCVRSGHTYVDRCEEMLRIALGGRRAAGAKKARKG